ncbi:MAG: hypothetical protein MRY21_07785 [Simkaniaceae bacterium]|nr:hypothetical protein [Simkaniaceae bacterium]
MGCFGILSAEVNAVPVRYAPRNGSRHEIRASNTGGNILGAATSWFLDPWYKKEVIYCGVVRGQSHSLPNDIPITALAVQKLTYSVGRKVLSVIGLIFLFWIILPCAAMRILEAKANGTTHERQRIINKKAEMVRQGIPILNYNSLRFKPNTISVNDPDMKRKTASIDVTTLVDKICSVSGNSQGFQSQKHLLEQVATSIERNIGYIRAGQHHRVQGVNYVGNRQSDYVAFWQSLDVTYRQLIYHLNNLEKKIDAIDSSEDQAAYRELINIELQLWFEKLQACHPSWYSSIVDILPRIEILSRGQNTNPAQNAKDYFLSELYTNRRGAILRRIGQGAHRGRVRNPHFREWQFLKRCSHEWHSIGTFQISQLGPELGLGQPKHDAIFSKSDLATDERVRTARMHFLGDINGTTIIEQVLDAANKDGDKNPDVQGYVRHLLQKLPPSERNHILNKGAVRTLIEKRLEGLLLDKLLENYETLLSTPTLDHPATEDQRKQQTYLKAAIRELKRPVRSAESIRARFNPLSVDGVSRNDAYRLLGNPMPLVEKILADIPAGKFCEIAEKKTDGKYHPFTDLIDLIILQNDDDDVMELNIPNLSHADLDGLYTHIGFVLGDPDDEERLDYFIQNHLNRLSNKCLPKSVAKMIAKDMNLII